MKIPSHIPPVISPRVVRAIADELNRRSLLYYHKNLGFPVLHGGQPPVMAPYIEAICYVLQELAEGRIKRLIITVPPRHGKSEITAASFGSWMFGQDPSLKIMLASYGIELSGPQVANAKAIIASDRFRRIFPRTRIKRGMNRADVFGTTAGGEFRAVSQGGAATGFGADILIVDDLSKADEALTFAGREKAITFYRNSLPSRFDNPADGRVIVIQQRLHEEDLVGFLLDVGGFYHLNLPAMAEFDEVIPLSGGREWYRRKGDLLDPIRFPQSYLDHQRLLMGNRFYAAQYQQDPIASDGSLIKWAWFGQYSRVKNRSYYLKIVQSWDPAITERIHSDYSVGQTWGYRDGKWYLLDLIRAKLEYPRLRERVLEWHRQWRADALLIEGVSIGLSLAQDMRREMLPGKIVSETPRGSKQDRLASRSAQLETGDYLLPEAAPWLADFRRELLAFPDGRHDDQVDAMVQFLEFVYDRPSWVRATYGPDGRRTDPIIRSSLRRRSY
ncbi:phage terminase large subunit [Rhizorhabdus dicambivorans]|uniref:Terminase large subunit gp17-like C-terminal domain-containing protein n=1 Tax=Rhizorhabdus dicambivorans TaxID=1850238 RepID=A0A2A4FUA0_9SPHN|nr:phage terminase large subunit [Rhizorhabdus dicambivorans]ATE66199.1 hypothetical protein CMV14_18815 [Rhizorhabdus dicambivorans]PCE41709.1 hypothetical protein COO09_13150 [Rhizorhabdus dicambivorans]